MSYKIKILMISPLFRWKVKKTMNAWEEAIASLNKAMSDFINNQNLQGQAIVEYAQLPSRGAWDSSSNSGQPDE